MVIIRAVSSTTCVERSLDESTYAAGILVEGVI